MNLKILDVRNLRCIEHAYLELDARCNVIYGDNAAGKTSLLEAVFLLGTGRSFRTQHVDPLVQYGKAEFSIFGRTDGVPETAVGLRASSVGKEAKINGQSIKNFSELAQLLAVQVIDPDLHKLLEEGPARRRRFLDWGVFHVEPAFHAAWKRYHRALAQRNAALKISKVNEAIIWDHELSESGAQVAASRQRYVDSLSLLVQELGRELLGLNVGITHSPGWRSDIDLRTALSEARHRDQMRATTTVGIHRADLVVTIEGYKPKEQASRGQQKMLAAVLFLAQQAHRARLELPPACLLVDDPAAELDVDNLGKVLRAIARIPAQLIITSLNPDVVETHLPTRLFHVKHGRVALVA